MEKSRQQAYRHLLYEATLSIRPIAYPPWGRQRFNPFAWHRYYRSIFEAGELADWLHNVAEFSINDFEGFDEAFCWEDFDRLCARHPRFTFYRTIFDTELTRKG